MQAVNLIPADLRVGGGSRTGRSGGAVYVVLGGLAVLVAMMAMYVMTAHGMTAQQTELADLQTQVQKARAEVANDEAPGQVRAQRVAAVATVSQLAKQRMDWATLFDELGRTLPTTISLNALDASIDPSTSGTAGATPVVPGAPGTSGPTVQLSGCAPSHYAVAELMPKLRALPEVVGVQLVNSTMLDKNDAAGSGAGGTASAAAGGTMTPCVRDAFQMVLSLAPIVAPTAAATGTTPGAAVTPATGAAPAAAAPATTTPATTTQAPPTPAASAPAATTSATPAPATTPAPAAPTTGAGG